MFELLKSGISLCITLLKDFTFVLAVVDCGVTVCHSETCVIAETEAT